MAAKNVKSQANEKKNRIRPKIGDKVQTENITN